LKAGAGNDATNEGEAMSITPAECKTARKLVGWSQHDQATDDCGGDCVELEK
jgi:hypothetical protein